jgi:uncharacterized protein YjiS (DUF1127 family)
MVTARHDKPLNSVYRWVNDSLARAGRWQRRRLARRELMALDDHLLEDIGLRRWEIDGVVKGMFPEGAAARGARGISRVVKGAQKTAAAANDRYYDSAA